MDRTSENGEAGAQCPALPDAARNALQRLIRSLTPLLPEAEASATFFGAVAAHSEGRVDDADQAYRSMLLSDPAHPGALFSLGVIRLHQGAVDEGLGLVDSAVDQYPTSAENLFHCGMLLGSLGRSQRQIDRLFASLAVTPNAQVELALSQSLEALGRTAEALYHCDRAIALDGGFGLAWSAKGGLMVELGRLTEARTVFEKATAMTSGRAQAYLGLAELGVLEPASPDFETMSRLCSDSGLGELDRPVIHFALGAALQHSGKYRQALQSYIVGNSLRRPSITYDELQFMELVSRARTSFSREAINRDCGAQSGLPVFIVGMPRSGSTLIEQILSSHPAVFGAGEINDWSHMLYRNRLHPIERVLTLPDEELGRIGGEYVFVLQQYRPGAQRVVNKMLVNFLSLGAIRLALPKASIIHARRNPVDTCVSCFSKLFAVNFSYDLAELGRYYKAYNSLMAHWREVLPPGAVLDVSYEDLVANFEPQARRIVEFCGLEWDKRCLKFYETRRVVRTVSGSQVRRPIYSGTTGRWDGCSDLLQPLLSALSPELHACACQ